MMHRCSSSHNMVGPCSCGLFHTQSNSSLSMFFSSMPTSHKPTNAAFDENSDPYPCPYPYPYPYPAAAASSVDCTLSLGTPSTRLSEDTAATDGDGKRSRGGAGQERRSSISNFCWDILGQNTSRHAPPSQSHKSAARGGGSSTSSGSSSSCSGDPLLARRCANCDTTSTPLWRNGPRGPKSLCNACGIRFKKEERRATAAAATAGNGASGGGGAVEGQHLFGHHHYSSWASQAPQQKLPCFGGEFRFIDDDSRDSDNGISFLSWRLNVTDRPSGLVHDFTR